jgi:hypothetical protein
MGRWFFKDGKLQHSDFSSFVFSVNLNHDREWKRLGAWMEENQPSISEDRIQELISIGANADAYNELCNELNSMREGIVDKIVRGLNPELSSNPGSFIKIKFNPANIKASARLYEILKEVESIPSVTIEFSKE